MSNDAGSGMGGPEKRGEHRSNTEPGAQGASVQDSSTQRSPPQTPHNRPTTELAILLVRNHRHLDMVLTGFVELGLPEVAVAEVQGMGQILGNDVPIFAGLRSMFPGGTGEAHLILAPIPSEAMNEVIDMIIDVCGPFDEPDSALLVTVPMLRHHGPSPIF